MNELKGLIVNFSEIDDEAAVIKNALVDLTKDFMWRNYADERICPKFSLATNYADENEKAKNALLAFCAKKAGINKIVTKGDVVRAFEDVTFSKIYNSIIVDTLGSIILGGEPQQLLELANVSSVDVGDSDTFEIDPKGLPIAQRTSYTTNVTFLDSYAVSPITITPKPYSVGTSMDYVRILSKSYDMGREIGRVARAMLMAQLKLVIDLIYSVANVNTTPLYLSSFSGSSYTQLISDLKMLNGDSDVTAYGTLPAFYAMGVTATTNYGLMAQDEMIRKGYLGEAYGVRNRVINQITDLSAPFTTANASTLRVIPNDRVILLSSVGDKPVKLVRENFVRVRVKDAKDGAQYRQNYEYFMSFDGAIATQAHYGIVSVG